MKYTKSISDIALCDLIHKQLEAMIPDGDIVVLKDIEAFLKPTFDRLFFCFERISIKYYRKDGSVFFNHLHSDHYCTLLYLMSNVAYKNAKENLATKLFLLNKYLHGVDLFYSIELPDIFLLSHPIGSILGNAQYEDFLVIYQNCTVGGIIKEGEYFYPIIGVNVTLYSNVSILGNSVLGENVIVGANTFLVNDEISDNSIVLGSHPNLKILLNKKTKTSPFFYLENKCRE